MRSYFSVSANLCAMCIYGLYQYDVCDWLIHIYLMLAENCLESVMRFSFAKFDLFVEIELHRDIVSRARFTREVSPTAECTIVV